MVSRAGGPGSAGCTTYVTRTDRGITPWTAELTVTVAVYVSGSRSVVPGAKVRTDPSAFRFVVSQLVTSEGSYLTSETVSGARDAPVLLWIVTCFAAGSAAERGTGPKLMLAGVRTIVGAASAGSTR